MDNWTKKKRAAESFGGQGMTKYIDSNEARRLSRLKNVRSSIGGTMSQHSGWQRDQIEKRRREQLRQRKKHAKKKPLGEGIRVDTSVQPYDYTKTGLKLKLDQPPTTKQIVKEKALSSLSRLQTRKESAVKGYGPRPLNDIPKQETYSSREVTPVDVCLLDDGAIVDKVVHEESIKRSQSLAQVKERLKDLSVSSTANKNAPTTNKTSKRNSYIPRFSGQTSISKNKYQSDEGKENGDNSFDHQPMLQSSRTSNLKKPEPEPKPKKHFQLLTDINSLKRERADALKMLQELDREENRRRSLGSVSTSFSFDSDEASDDEFGGNAMSGVDGDFDDCDEKNLSHREDEFGEIVSSSEACSSGADTEPKTLGNNPEESFAWLPDGIKDATHLSIVLNDDIESQEDAGLTGDSTEYDDEASPGGDVFDSSDYMVDEQEGGSQEEEEEVSVQSNDCSEDDNCDEDKDESGVESYGARSESSSHTDEYLSDTSGY